MINEINNQIFSQNYDYVCLHKFLKDKHYREINRVYNNINMENREFSTIEYFSNATKLSNATIRRWANDNNLKVYSELEKKRFLMLREYKPEESIKGNAKKLNCNRDTIRNLLKWVNKNRNEDWFIRSCNSLNINETINRIPVKDMPVEEVKTVEKIIEIPLIKKDVDSFGYSSRYDRKVKQIKEKEYHWTLMDKIYNEKDCQSRTKENIVKDVDGIISEKTVERWAKDRGIHLLTNCDLKRFKILINFNENLSDVENSLNTNTTVKDILTFKKWLEENRNEKWFNDIIKEINFDMKKITKKEMKKEEVKQEAEEKEDKITITKTTSVDIFREKFLAMSEEEISKINLLFN